MGWAPLRWAAPPEMGWANVTKLHTLFHLLFSQENSSTPALVGLELFYRPEKDFGGNETKSKAGQCKGPIIYSISSPLGLCLF